jgi:hypothetical protein
MHLVAPLIGLKSKALPKNTPNLDMNGHQIRIALKHSIATSAPERSVALTVEELGLLHGRSRADLALIDRSFIGYEIKGEGDDLRRLGTQVAAYNAVFDYSWIVVTEQHLRAAAGIVPVWWGILLALRTDWGEVDFFAARQPSRNPATDDLAIAHLLWRTEAQAILLQLGFRGAELRRGRSLLYEDVVRSLSPSALRRQVGSLLSQRRGWRDQSAPVLYDDSFQPRETE